MAAPRSPTPVNCAALMPPPAIDWRLRRHIRRGDLARDLLRDGRSERRARDGQADRPADLLEEGQTAAGAPSRATGTLFWTMRMNTANVGPTPMPVTSMYAHNTGTGVSACIVLRR